MKLVKKKQTFSFFFLMVDVESSGSHQTLTCLSWAHCGWGLWPLRLQGIKLRVRGVKFLNWGSILFRHPLYAPRLYSGGPFHFFILPFSWKHEHIVRLICSFLLFVLEIVGVAIDQRIA